MSHLSPLARTGARSLGHPAPLPPALTGRAQVTASPPGQQLATGLVAAAPATAAARLGVASPPPTVTVDGQRWLQERLAAIRDRVASGERVQVVFDIDDTLFDSRSRTVTLAKEWDAQNGTSYFADLRKTDCGWDGYQTARNLKLPKEVAQAFDRFWEARFYGGETLAMDTPVAAMHALAHAAKGAGAEVRYCTARPEEMREATRAQLQQAGLPDVTDETLALKPRLEDPSAAYKVETLSKWAAEEGSVGFFITESRRDVAAIQQGVEDVPTVLLAHPKEGGGRHPVDPQTPIYPGLFDAQVGEEDSLWGVLTVAA